MASSRHGIRPLCNFLQKSHLKIFCNGRTVCRGLSSQSKDGSGQQQTPTENTKLDPQEVFIRPEVQSILHQITGTSLDKIFKERLTNTMSRPKYRLLTDEELDEELAIAKRRAKGVLQMPPYLNPRKDTSEVITENPELEGHKDFNLIFTDISLGIKNDNRVIAVREPSGTLRHANATERDRVLQAYFPLKGRTFHQPSMFHAEQLEIVLMKGKYEYVLNRACIQFEPDDPEYIRVAHRTYEHVAKEKQFEILWCTRHYGPMAFYLAKHGKIENLIIYMINNERIEDASELVKLFHILHPENKSAVETEKENITDPFELIMSYAKKGSKRGGQVELVLQGYAEQHKSQSSAN